MELKSLVIKNIASIESARIDFCEEPLRDEAIFLICGETGAGKSTILDAICLALYNQAPRLAAAAKEWIGDDALPAGKRDPEGDISTEDPKQFLRKGAVEASVTLVFTGLDGMDYTSVWSVRRAYGNIERKIQDIVWTISWGNGEILHKRNDVKYKVEQVTGMTFEQYCRTSMLAQGEFARFLKSEENAKADILEKLTRTDIYARIGARLALKTKEKKEACDRQLEKISGIVLLDGEERKALQEQVASKEASLDSMLKKKEEMSLKLRWIQTQTELEEKVAKSRLEVQEARAVTASEEFLCDEKTCQEWDATSGQRSALVRKKELEASERKLTEEVEAAGNAFVSLSCNLAVKESELAGMMERYDNIDRKLQSRRQYAGMYALSESICERLRTVISGKTTINGLTAKLVETEAKRKEHTAAHERQMESLAEMRQERDFVRKRLESLLASISAADKKAKTAAKEKTDAGISLVKDAGLSVKEMQKAYARKSKEQATLESYRKSYEEAKEKAAAAHEAFVTADSRYAEAYSLYDRMKDSLDNWAKVARSKLQPGGKCPLCGQEIHSVATDEDFEKIMAPINSDLERKSAERKSAEICRNDAVAAVKSLETSIRNEETVLKAAEEEYFAARKEAVSGCDSISVSPDDENVLDVLRDRYRSLEAVRETLIKDLETISEQERSAMALQENIDRQAGRIESGTELLKQTAEEISSLEKDAAGLRAGVSAASRNVESAISQIDKDMAGIKWQDAFDAAPEEFISAFKRESEQYSKDKEEASALSASIGEKKTVLGRIEETRRDILVSFPSWAGNDSGKRIKTSTAGWEDILKEWIGLYSKANSIKDRIKSIEKDISILKAFLEEFYVRQEISAERLESLASMSPEDVGRLKDSVASRRSAAATAESVLAQRENDLMKHRLSSPEMDAGDTAESLGSAIMEIETGINAMNRDIGAIRQRLVADDENSRLAGHEKEIAEKLIRQSEKWNRLNSIFGDAEGKKFKKIAQGYVMSELVRNANVYLSRLSGRYVLDSQPGSLTLTVRDMYQGGAVRSVMTLSGGETFLVSLSLALGLSSLSHGSLKVNILFIDEGFGTLSSEYLNTVMEALENLHQIGGRKVGIISHIESLRERVPTQIRVKRHGNSSSTVEIVAATS